MKTMNLPGIYVLYFDTDDSLYYIGMSIHIHDRYIDHLYYLKKNKHHNYKLQQLYNKYNVDPSICVLEYTDTNNLPEKEIYWINIFDSYNNGLNCTGGGEGAGFGEGSPSALHEASTYECIFTMLAEGTYLYREIAEELQVSINIVNSIATGGSHRYLQVLYPDYWKNILSKYNKRAFKYSEDIYINIFKELVHTVKKHPQIAKEFDVTLSTVEEISACTSHTYLKELFPEEYKILEKKKGIRRAGSHSGKAYPDVISPEGVVHTNIINAKQFAMDHALHPGHFGDLLRGTVNQHKGWRRA